MRESDCETRGRFCDGLGSNIVVQCSVVPIISLHNRITARKYVARLGYQVHPMIQALFPKKKNNAKFSKKAVPPLTKMELLSRDLKSMKVNLTSSLASTITRFGRQ
jgi:hypothetical protein